MAALREDWQVLQGLFPAGWEELGRSSGAVVRLRGFSSLNDLFRTLAAARRLWVVVTRDGCTS
jgi:hypothetical protein